MIRGNWSLAAEVRSNERKQQNKVQQRQKHSHKLQKLESIDPIRLYYQIQKLEKQLELSERDAKYLKGLKEDWEFIEKNKLHQEKLAPFLEKLAKDKKQKEIASKKLWGQASVYFNPELNPLGKVPQLPGSEAALENLIKPLKSHQQQRYEKDPLIDSLGVVLPEGEPPKFYRLVQNTGKVVEKEVSGIAQPISGMAPRVLQQKRKKTTVQPKEDEEDNYKRESELAPEEEEYLVKKPKIDHDS